MCLIIVADTARPKAKEIEDADSTNPDGLGIAYKESGSNLVTWRKGISVEELTALSQSVPLPYVMHFRLATHGGKSAGLCHPFPISRNVGTAVEGQAREVLFHNGIWNEHVQFTPSLRGSASDTRIMAWVLWRTGDENRDGTAQQIATQAGRLVLFSPTRVMRFGQWEDGARADDSTTDGCFYSNLNHCWTTRSFNTTGAYHGVWDEYDNRWGGYSLHGNKTVFAKKTPPVLPEVKEEPYPQALLDPVTPEPDSIDIKCAACDQSIPTEQFQTGCTVSHELICDGCAYELGLLPELQGTIS